MAQIMDGQSPTNESQAIRRILSNIQCGFRQIDVKGNSDD